MFIIFCAAVYQLNVIVNRFAVHELFRDDSIDIYSSLLTNRSTALLRNRSIAGSQSVLWIIMSAVVERIMVAVWAVNLKQQSKPIPKEPSGCSFLSN